LNKIPNISHKTYSLDRIGLGTVQFGLDYGISNSQGQVPQAEVERILNKSVQIGIQLLDTASLYGTSETVIGHSLSKHNGFKIITKTLVCNSNSIDESFCQKVDSAFKKSLQLLKQKRVYGLLIHHTTDLLKPGSKKLIDLLQDYRDQNLVTKIGVSAYNESEVNAVLEEFTPDIIQIPLNIMDQRLLNSGTIKALKKRGIEIHARSLFLQGALLMDVLDLPEFLSPISAKFKAIGNAAKDLNLTLLELSLLFGLQTEVDNLIIGVTSIDELEILEKSVLNLKNQNSIDLTSLASNEEKYINPALWFNLKNQPRNTR
jgi:aryl-alcohol dehydrogenase-like predicted oxidoreductase